MAIPTTQKECTTRRIAALIIGLWDKIKNAFLLKTSRGTANGVASLDANGKVPSSQLPSVPSGNLPSNSSSSAGIVASGSGMVSKVWGTDVSGNPAWRDVSTTFGLAVTQNSKYRRVATLQFSANDYAASGIVGTIFFRYYDSVRTGQVDFALSFRDYEQDYIVGSMYSRNSRGSLPSIRIGAVKVDTLNYELWTHCDTYSTSVVSCKIEATNGCSVEHKNDSPTDTAPSGYTEAEFKGQYIGFTEQVGSTSVPVYLDPNGIIQECTSVVSLDANGKIPESQLPNKYRIFPNLNFFEHGYNQGILNQYIKIAEISCNGIHLDHPIIFRLMSRYQGQCLIYIQLEESSARYPGLGCFRVISPYERGKSYADIKMTYVDNSTHRVYSLWGNPGAWSQLESVAETDYTLRPLITMISGVYSTSLTNPIEPTYQKEIFTKNAGNRVGSESVPVFVENTGEVKPCTNVPVIEHVTTIPVNPTVGTIYAL